LGKAESLKQDRRWALALEELPNHTKRIRSHKTK
jgi:hypothetical protein